MKNADQANPKQLFRKCGGCFDGWDKIAGWILLLALVLGGTQVLPAQHSQDIRDATKQPEKTGTAKQTEKTLPAADERQHWTAEPGCFGPENDVPDRTVSRSWTLMSVWQMPVATIRTRISPARGSSISSVSSSGGRVESRETAAWIFT